METSRLYELFRTEVRDSVEPYLWEDTDVYHYIDEAQKMFCRLTWGLADATSTLTQIPVVIGEKWVTLSPKLLKIREARLASNNNELTILNFEDRQSFTGGFIPRDDYGNLTISRTNNDNLPGPVTALVVGQERNKGRLIQVPVATDTIQLTVYRLPRNTIEDDGTALEIDEQHHRYLLDWMKHLAYSKQDAETYDKGRMIEFEAKFRAYCDTAKGERERREHKYRTMAYGGI